MFVFQVIPQCAGHAIQILHQKSSQNKMMALILLIMTCFPMFISAGPVVYVLGQGSKGDLHSADGYWRLSFTVSNNNPLPVVVSINNEIGWYIEPTAGEGRNPDPLGFNVDISNNENSVCGSTGPTPELLLAPTRDDGVRLAVPLNYRSFVFNGCRVLLITYGGDLTCQDTLSSVELISHPQDLSLPCSAPLKYLPVIIKLSMINRGVMTPGVSSTDIQSFLSGSMNSILMSSNLYWRLGFTNTGLTPVIIGQNNELGWHIGENVADGLDFQNLNFSSQTSLSKLPLCGTASYTLPQLLIAPVSQSTGRLTTSLYARSYIFGGCIGISISDDGNLMCVTASGVKNITYMYITNHPYDNTACFSNLVNLNNMFSTQQGFPLLYFNPKVAIDNGICDTTISNQPNSVVINNLDIPMTFTKTMISSTTKSQTTTNTVTDSFSIELSAEITIGTGKDNPVNFQAKLAAKATQTEIESLQNSYTSQDVSTDQSAYQITLGALRSMTVKRSLVTSVCKYKAQVDVNYCSPITGVCYYAKTLGADYQQLLQVPAISFNN
jgi:hypothetical protein